MKRSLFSCCILLTALGIAAFSNPRLRAESDCESGSSTLDGVGHCACPYSCADSYGESFWEDEDCDRVADTSEYNQVAETESITISDGIEPCDDDPTDYWYDSESGSYYDYEFSNDEATVEQTVDAPTDPLDELFELCETESVDAPVEATTDVAAKDTTAEEAGPYGYEYDYYAEYEDYGYDCEEYEYRYGEDSHYAYESSDTVDWDAVVEQSDSEAVVGQASISDESVDAIVEDAWEDECYSEYDYAYDEYDEYEYDYEYGYENDDDWTEDQRVTVTEDAARVAEQAESVEETAGVVEEVQPWQYNEYDYGYDACPYDDEYEAYDYEYWDETDEQVEPAEADANLPIVSDEPDVETDRSLPRAAVLSLARTLNRIGSTLQSISQQMTQMVDEEVAQQPGSETLER